ncbi:MAG: hypothetical protein N3C62_00645 [Synergistetes bacterium]|nr:hypothetical protein [Synergistota bacterium]MCX8127246.1 hypothetical protein [Synergistota bacterium]MDW8191868.1 hypothetical protein [Synergistota bacterium]
MYKVELVENFFNILNKPLTDLPEFVTIEEYDKVIDFLLSRWQKLTFRPISIYQVGEIGSPGFSDLDFIVVFPTGSFVNIFRFDPKSFPEWVRKLFVHMPLFCSEISWDYLLGWFPVSNLRWLWGEKLDCPRIPSYVEKGNAFGMLVDYLIVKIPVDWLQFLFTEPIRLRLLVSLLYSVNHTFRLALKAGLNLSSRWGELLSGIELFRNRWWSRDLKDNLTDLMLLCINAYNLVSELILEIDKTISCFCDANIRVGKGIFEFSSLWDPVGVLEEVYRFLRLNGEIKWVSPISFREVLMFYAKVCHQFIDYFKRYSFYSSSNWDGGIWADGLSYHAKAMLIYSQEAYRIGAPPSKYISLGYLRDFCSIKLISLLSAHAKFLLSSDITLDEFGEVFKRVIRWS